MPLNTQKKKKSTERKILKSSDGHETTAPSNNIAVAPKERLPRRKQTIATVYRINMLDAPYTLSLINGHGSTDRSSGIMTATTGFDRLHGWSILQSATETWLLTY